MRLVWLDQSIFLDQKLGSLWSIAVLSLRKQDMIRKKKVKLSLENNLETGTGKREIESTITIFVWYAQETKKVRDISKIHVLNYIYDAVYTI